MYVIQRHKDDAFVSKHGMACSYTHNLADAQKYLTKEDAIGDKCDNESVVDLENILDGLRR